MNQVYPDDGLVMQLVRILTAGIKVHLFVNNATISRATTLGDLTEATHTGYAAITLDNTDFTTTGVVSNTGYAIAPPISFANSSGGDVSAYGYYITDTAGTKLLAAAKFDGAPLVRGDGESWLVTPAWGDFSGLAA